MAKAVRVAIDNETLMDMLGIRDTDIVFYHAQLVYGTWGKPVVEFVLYGEDLPHVFAVHAGNPIKKGEIVYNSIYGASTIKPLEG